MAVKLHNDPDAAGSTQGKDKSEGGRPIGPAHPPWMRHTLYKSPAGMV